MNYPLNSSRLSRLDGGVGLLSSHVVYNTAYEGGVYRLVCKLVAVQGQLLNQDCFHNTPKLPRK